MIETGQQLWRTDSIDNVWNKCTHSFQRLRIIIGPEFREPEKEVDLDNAIVQGDKTLHNVYKVDHQPYLWDTYLVTSVESLPCDNSEKKIKHFLTFGTKSTHFEVFCKVLYQCTSTFLYYQST